MFFFSASSLPPVFYAHQPEEGKESLQTVGDRGVEKHRRYLSLRRLLVLQLLLLLNVDVISRSGIHCDATSRTFWANNALESWLDNVHKVHKTMNLLCSVTAAAESVFIRFDADFFLRRRCSLRRLHDYSL